MRFFPTDPKKLKTRIRSYERALRKPDSDDGYGKRFLVGPMYLLLGDAEGAILYYDWYLKKFPDDGIEPLNHVSWALALKRIGKNEAAERKLLEAALENPHIWDWLYGGILARWDIWYGTNFAEPEYLSQAPEEFLNLWEEDELAWAHNFSMTETVASVMTKQRTILSKLMNLAPGKLRSEQVDQLFALRDMVRRESKAKKKLVLLQGGKN